MPDSWAKPTAAGSPTPAPDDQITVDRVLAGQTTADLYARAEFTVRPLITLSGRAR